MKNKQWLPFEIESLFNIKIGKNIDANKVDKTSGKYAYITRKESNNGLDGFIDEKLEYLNKNYPALTIGNETCEPFVHNYKFFTGTKINILSNKIYGVDLLKFIATSLRSHKDKYSYSYTINSSRLKKQKVLLPSCSNELPDYEYMKSYIQEIRAVKEKEYTDFIFKRYEELENTQEPERLEDKKWGDFFMEDLLTIKSGVRLTKANQKSGCTPFIGASDSNNGVTSFISNINNSLDRNVLGVNYNGSVVENFFHPYEAIFSDDVKRISFKKIIGNKYQYLFLKCIILQQRNKYQYGYKFNAARMKRQKLSFPLNTEGEPDYEYMEQYIKYLEYQKLKDYLEFKGKL